MALFKGRKPEVEDTLPSLTLPGDVKERLQLKPNTPAKKKPAGENWRKFKANGNSLADLAGDKTGTESDTDGPVETTIGFQYNKENASMNGNARTVLGLRRALPFQPSYDDVAGQEIYEAQRRIATDGAIVERDALKEKQTNEHSEHLYEEITDKQTGKKSLLFRQNFFDRY